MCCVLAGRDGVCKIKKLASSNEVGNQRVAGKSRVDSSRAENRQQKEATITNKSEQFSSSV